MPLSHKEIPYRDSELLRRAIKNLPRVVSGDRQFRPHYALVAELFECETHVACALCHRHGVNPDATQIDWEFLDWRDVDDGK